MSRLPTREQIAVFATSIFDRDDIVEIRRLPSGRSSWHLAEEMAGQADELSRDNMAGEDIYAGLNPRRMIGGTKAAHVAIARCLFVDIERIDPAEAGERISSAGLPKPTLMLRSGHGIHAYWRLTEPIENLATWTSMQRRLARALRSDPRVIDPPRIARLPGFTNHKPPKAIAGIVDE